MRRRRIRRKREKRKRYIRALIARCIVFVLVVIVLAFVFRLIGKGISLFFESKKQEVAEIMAENEKYGLPTIVMWDDEEEPPGEEAGVSEDDVVGETDEKEGVYSTVERKLYSYGSDNAVQLSSPEFTSPYGILVNVSTQQVTAVRSAHERIAPASMTKVLTLLLACEYIQESGASVDDEVEMTYEATNYSYVNGCSNVGFSVGEKVCLYDLLCGTILPSGADAAYTLALYVSGSHEAFVESMNKRLDELNLPDPAHFTNCVGIYDDNHYCSCYDMAVIMNAAMDNPLAREVLGYRKYTTRPTAEHPEGIALSNLFLRRIEDWDTKGNVTGAKTGFVNESMFCAVSYYECENGNDYVCVSAGGVGKWKPIRDHSAAYNIYAAGNTSYHRD